MQRTTYLIDSENVNDAWVKLLPGLGKKDRIIVFYTENSPHFNVDSARVITEHRDKDITWKKCFAGKNALDFQLVSQMGYFISKYPQDSYVIMSNDTGFDAAVKFWMEQRAFVSRIRGNGKAVTGTLAEAVKERRNAEESRKMEGGRTHQEAPLGEENKKSGIKGWFLRWFSDSPVSLAQEISGETVEEVLAENEKKAAVSDKGRGYSRKPYGNRGYREKGQSVREEAAERKGGEGRSESSSKEVSAESVIGLCRSIPIRRQERLHEALVALLGGEDGREVYRFLKENKEFHEKLTTIYLDDRNARIDNYLKIIFRYHNIQLEQTEDIRRLLNKYQTRDLNGLYKAMTGCFGKNRGSQYYGIVKPHIRVIKKL